MTKLNLELNTISIIPILYGGDDHVIFDFPLGLKFRVENMTYGDSRIFLFFPDDFWQYEARQKKSPTFWLSITRVMDAVHCHLRLISWKVSLFQDVIFDSWHNF
ncbi:MAG: hypothetical protein D6732_18760 [Methanobacteriota archaeon]|nr:MAG: hypothetical protein D6732_18760 [Euryarchaeota archaeon]